MGKKKNKKKQKKSCILLSEFDTSLNGRYDSLVDEIGEIQRKLSIADAKAEEKQRKKMIRQEMGVIPYYVSKDKVKAREKALKKMEETDLLTRIENSFKQMVPCIVIIARLVAALIVAILSFEPFRRLIKPVMMDRLNVVYKLAMAIH